MDFGVNNSNININWPSNVSAMVTNFTEALLNITFPAYNGRGRHVQHVTEFASSASATWIHAVPLTRFQFGKHIFQYLVKTQTTVSAQKEIAHFRS